VDPAEVDVAVVGAGGAGLTLLHQLALRGPAGLRVALVDPVRRLRDHPDDRTWCFWDDGTSDIDEALARSWSRVLVATPGSRQELDLAPMRYAMLRSSDYYRLVESETAGLDVVPIESAVTSLDDDGARVVVRTPAGDVAARWVFDSRPAPPARAGVTTLLQHFRGAVVRTADDVFDADLPTLMDFTTAQPPRGLSFGYCLPLDARRALVEYTEFSPQVLDDDGYTAALGAYLQHVLGGAPHEVEQVEQGAIPMTDGHFARRSGPRVFRLGTAGGATRASTGYTFTAMQRQATSVAVALRAGREPLPPQAYPRRHALMDAAMLRGIDAGHLDGPAFFARLFAANPPQRVLRFLDGRTRISDEVALMRTAPAASMVRSGVETLGLRLRRRG